MDLRKHGGQNLKIVPNTHTLFDCTLCWKDFGFNEKVARNPRNVFLSFSLSLSSKQHPTHLLNWMQFDVCNGGGKYQINGGDSVRTDTHTHTERLKLFQLDQCAIRWKNPSFVCSYVKSKILKWDFLFLAYSNFFLLFWLPIIWQNECGFDFHHSDESLKLDIKTFWV